MTDEDEIIPKIFSSHLGDIGYTGTYQNGDLLKINYLNNSGLQSKVPIGIWIFIIKISNKSLKPTWIEVWYNIN